MAVGANPSSIPVPVSKTLGAASEKTSSHCLVKALVLLTAVTIARLVVIARLPLTGDEAYYWQWSRHPALGYHDHPPLIGWLIKLSSLLGLSAFWVRFPSVVLSFLSGVFLFLFARKISGKANSAFSTLALLVCVPVFSICALAAFPDAPLVFSWSLFLWAAWEWLSQEEAWPWMGLALGLAGLSKLMGLFLLPSFTLFLLWTDPPKFKKTSFWKSIALALLLCSPFLWWNAHHHFETFTYQLRQRLDRGFSFSPSLSINYIGLQFVSLSPLVPVLIAFTTLRILKMARRKDPAARFVLCMALPIHIFFLGVSLFSRVGLHWALPGYLSLFAAAPIWADELKNAGKSWGQTLFSWSLAGACALSLFFFALFLRPQTLVPWISARGIRQQGVNQGKTLNAKSMAEILGYRELGERIRDQLAALGAAERRKIFVFTDSYSLSSVISFYAGIDAKTLLFTSTGGDYARWNHFENYRGADALYVDTQPIGSRPDINQTLQKAFEKITALPPLIVKRGSVETDVFHFARCRRLINARALEPARPW